ncbi:hypothetical protein MNB_SV-13-824 [hydrothermal vent metagenome]|uniref:Lipoprotein n=1 Tax=hydrothermal vent metagenome TaxID=652676 RepID=A0A1W1D1D2_9ZZZZ
MKRMKLTLIALVGIFFTVGCGSSNDGGYITADNMRERFNFINDGFVSTRNSTQACIQGGTGDSYTIRTTFDHDNTPSSLNTNESVMTVITEEYRKSGCAGTAKHTVTQEYILFIGQEINQATRLEIDVLLSKFDFAFQDIRDFSEAILFGTNISVGEKFHTVIVGQGGLQTDTLKYGFANANEAHNGVTADFRASDVSKYTSGNTFLLQK